MNKPERRNSQSIELLNIMNNNSFCAFKGMRYHVEANLHIILSFNIFRPYLNDTDVSNNIVIIDTYNSLNIPRLLSIINCPQ